MSESRVPAGVPTGGQFAVRHRPEASNVLVMPLALDTTVPADQPIAFGRQETGSRVFDQVSISRVPGSDSFRVTGTVEVDLRAAVMSYFDDDAKDAETWLEQYDEVVREHLWDRYDAGLDPDQDDWSAQRFEVRTDVPCDARLDDAFEAAERSVGAQRLSGLEPDDLVHGMARAVNAYEQTAEDHAMGVHEEWGPGGNPECSECLAEEGRLQDMADAIRKGEW